MTDGSACSTFEGPREDGLEEQLTRLHPRLEAHLAHSSRRVPGVEPEDLSQEVVRRALLYRDKFDGSRAIWPWLRQVAQRVIVDQRAAVGRRAEESLELEVADTARVSSIESREELHRVLDLLKPIEREVLLRFHQGEESVREISSELNLREGTVKSHLSRARRRLAGLEDQELQHE